MNRPKPHFNATKYFKNHYPSQTSSATTTTTTTTTLQMTTTSSLIGYEKELVNLKYMSNTVFHGNTM